MQALWNTRAVDTDQPFADIEADLLERARTAASGYPELEDVLRRVDSIEALELDQLPAEFDTIHQLLRAALGDVQ